MSRWFRMYSEILDDPKVQKLPPALFKVWVNLLCLASRHDGKLPQTDDIAFALRIDEETCGLALAELVERGLIDYGKDFAPHNWDARQFKTDTAENAAERKREQRKREKQRDKGENVTADVTTRHCDSHNDVTPPETDTEADTEQSREEARATQPKHCEEVQDFLKDRTDDLTDWEVEFLQSVKWKPNLTPAQADVFKSIREKLKSTGNGGFALPVVKRGTAAYDAWIAHYRKRGRAAFYESRESLTVPSEYPPQEQAA